VKNQSQHEEAVTPLEIQKALFEINTRQRVALLDLGSAHGATLNALVRRGLIVRETKYDYSEGRIYESYSRTPLGKRVQSVLQKKGVAYWRKLAKGHAR